MTTHKRSWYHLIDHSQPIYNDADMDAAIKAARKRVRRLPSIYRRDAYVLARFHRMINLP